MRQVRQTGGRRPRLEDPEVDAGRFSIFKGIEDAKILVGKCGREIFRLAISYGYVDVFPLDDLNRSGFGGGSKP